VVVHHLGVRQRAFPARTDAAVLDPVTVVPVDHAAEGPHATLGRTEADAQFRAARFRPNISRSTAKGVTGVSAKASPPLLRRQLGRQLRRLRERARIDLGEAARVLDWSTPTLSRVETGNVRVDIHAVKSMLDLYGVTADRWPPLLELTRHARKQGWWRAYGISDRAYVPLEEGAIEVREFALAHVPGLLQTERYAWAIFRSSPFPRSEEMMAANVTVRMIRQRRLTSEEDPLRLVAVVDEGVLRRPIGGPEVMRAQLRHLAVVAELPTVTLHVLPTAAGAHTGMNGAFVLLRFDDPDEPELAYLDSVSGARYLEKDAEVNPCRVVFEDLRSKALSPADSAAFARQLAEEW
jgi:transcriptional regulator with XRE-family HTH domain